MEAWMVSIIISVIGASAGWFASNAQSRTTARVTAESAVATLLAEQRGYIKELQDQIKANNEELRLLRCEIEVLRGTKNKEIELYQERVRILEKENAHLRRMILALDPRAELPPQ